MARAEKELSITNDGPLELAQAKQLLAVGRSLVSELDLDAVLRRVLDTARDLTGARYAAIGVLDEGKRELERFLFVGIDEDGRRAIGPLPKGLGVLGELIRDPKPLRLRNVGEHPRSYGFPSGHPPMCTFLGVPVAVRGEAWGNLYLTEKQGGAEFDDADEQAVTVLADWAAVAIRNARLYGYEREHGFDLERAVSGLQATTEIARALGGETDVDRVLDLIVKRGRALVEARWSAIMIADGDELEVRASAGDLAAEPIGRRIPVKGTLAGQVLGEARPRRIDDVRVHIGAGRRGLAADLDANSAMYVPLEFRGHPVGLLLAADRLTGDGLFTTEDERLMLGFAASAATAVATAQSVEADRLRQSIEATEQERGRWARELHDETLQELGALKLMIEGALKSGRPDSVERTLSTAVDQIDHAITGLQSLITELRPASLDDLGVEAAIEALAERTQEHSGLDIDLSLELADESDRRFGRLAPDVESTVYRLVQEALNNVVKHARAKQVGVRVVERGGSVSITVRDDGHGFDPAATDGGFGLLGMRERVFLMKGTLDIASAPERGTTVHAVLPARRAGGAAATTAAADRAS